MFTLLNSALHPTLAASLRYTPKLCSAPSAASSIELIHIIRWIVFVDLVNRIPLTESIRKEGLIWI